MRALLIEDGSALSGTAIEKFDDLVQELTGNRDNPWKGLGYKNSAGPFRRRRCPNSKLQLFQRTGSSHNRRSSIRHLTRPGRMRPPACSHFGNSFAAPAISILLHHTVGICA